MSTDPDELIEAALELIEVLEEDGNVVGSWQLADRVAEWIDQNNNGDEIVLGE